ncbi:hypothetical protein BB561_002101 [Smittium simulii]|uniref:RING-type E3 ubiquitin transferase n=1 Tax=Smittium simulii TaxID=133385 RepID=A0A2T9YRP6_9FUNG|nr:hypothetical protein BB561_002101 [Smittium simulii]
MNYNSAYRLFLIFFCFWVILRNGSQENLPKSKKPNKEKWLSNISKIKFADLKGTTEWPKFAQNKLKMLTIPENSNLNNLYYKNISGLVIGDWENKNVNETTKWYNGTLSPEKTLFKDKERGQIYLYLNAKKTTVPDINFIQGFARLTNEDNSEFIDLEGIHTFKNGTFYLYGYKEQHLGIFRKLLNIMPDNSTLTGAKTILSKYYGKFFDELANENDIVPVCEYYIMGQIGPVDASISQNELENLEREMEYPTGEKTIKPPILQSKLFFFSTNCSNVITTISPPFNDTSKIAFIGGIKKQIYDRRATLAGFMALIVGLSQIFLLITQMEFTSTHSLLSKISAYTIGLYLLTDSYICLILFSTGLSISHAFTTLFAASFFPFIALSFFGFKYIILIRNTQSIESNSEPDEEENADSSEVYNGQINLNDLDNAQIESESSNRARKISSTSSNNDNRQESSSVIVSNKSCAICMQHIDLKISKTKLFQRLNYMVTPCHHAFHTSCLTDWMKIKLECPVCRAALPPV